MTNFALNVHEVGGVDFADKPSRLVPSNDVANQAFGIKGLVDLPQGVISVAMARILPGRVGFGMTGFAGRFRREHFFLLPLTGG